MSNIELMIEESADIAAYASDQDDASRRLLVGRVAPVSYNAKDEDSNLLSPSAKVVINVDEKHIDVVVQKLNKLKAETVELRPSGDNRQRPVLHASTCGLIGYQSYTVNG